MAQVKLLLLGATSAKIVAMIARKTVPVAVSGTAAGLLLSLAGGRYARSLLFSLKPDDPLTLVAAVSALIAGSLLASIWPALRATLIKPAKSCEANKLQQSYHGFVPTQ